MQWFGKPVKFNRFLGQVDQDDPTNLPAGLAARCRNTDFTRDSPGVTCAGTRAGINLAMRLIGLDGTNAQNPVTGGAFFAYSPETQLQSRFEMPILFEAGGQLQRELPVGTGHMVAIPPGPLFTPPTDSTMIAVPAENKLWASFSDLLEASAGWCCIDPYVIQTGLPVVPGIASVNPGGMRPVGWQWQKLTSGILQNEVACPAGSVTGNGHTYQAQNAGATGPFQPNWPLSEGGIVVEVLTSAQAAAGLIPVTWKEKTMVMANRLPKPPAPALALAGGGAFATGLDVYIIIALANAQGLSLGSIATKITTIASSSTVVVSVPALTALAGWIQTLTSQYIPTLAAIYVAEVSAGSPAPAVSHYAQFGAEVALGTNANVTGPGGGAAPPSKNTARVTPGQLPTPDTEVDIERSPAAGTFPAGRDVYVLQTYTNSIGETKAGPTNSVVDTVLNDGIQVTVDVPEDENGKALYSIATVGIYEADVATGTPAPPASQFALVGFYAAGATPTITATANGVNPPTSNSTGPGGAIVADTSTGGPDGGQGYRYAALLFMNQNETVSGFTVASVIQYDVDEDGWELGFFNILVGPQNTVARLIAPTVADSSQDGPFNWSGVINLIDQSQNVVYPTTVLDGNVQQTATAIFDNVTNQATFNFTDTFISNTNNVDDRINILAPFQPVRIDYLKTINALAFTGVKGYTGGALVSIPGDPESVYASVGNLPFPSDGQRCYGLTDAYKSVILALREEGGWACVPNTGDAATWSVEQRWSDYGPCGFRAWAANGKFVCFVHRSGFYKYDQADPNLMSKEIPRQWSTINWEASAGIAVTIDEDTHTVRIQVPTGSSTENNEEFCLSYLEGWQNPIHYSPISGNESSMDAARRWSFNDVAASFCLRMNRTLPPGPPLTDGPDWTTVPDSSFRVSQLLYGSSAPDGTVQARTPGVFNDNGQGIDWVYETMSAGMMQSVAKPEGINLNAVGNGLIAAYFLASRNQVEGPDGEVGNEVLLGEFPLNRGQQEGITLKCEPFINEYVRVRFTNKKTADAWCSLKSMMVFLIPWTGGRGELDLSK